MAIGVILVLCGDTELSVLESCQALSTETIRWYIISALGPDQLASSSDFIYHRRCTIWLHDHTPPVSAALNDALMRSFADACQFTMLLDQRAVFRPSGLDLLIYNMLKDLSGIALCCNSESSNDSFAVFALGSAAYNLVGAFDENIEEVKFITIDYLIRARQSGISVSVVENVIFEGDQQDVLISSSFSQKEYLEKKWGSLPNTKTQQLPFGNMGHRIGWGSRVHPYGASHDLPRTSRTKPATIVDVIPSFFDEQAIESELSDVARQALSASVVRAVFQSLLCREPDPPALSMYCEQLTMSSITPAILCDVVRSSDEYRNLHSARQATHS